MKHLIKEVRKEKGITQKELAERLQITRQGVSSIENSESVTLNTLEKVAAALGCRVYELIATGEPMSFDSPDDYEAYCKQLGEAEEKALTEYMKRLSVPVRDLNQLGRETLLDNAEMMSHNEKYSSTINITFHADGSETITFGKKD